MEWGTVKNHLGKRKTFLKYDSNTQGADGFDVGNVSKSGGVL